MQQSAINGPIQPDPNTPNDPQSIQAEMQSAMDALRARRAAIDSNAIGIQNTFKSAKPQAAKGFFDLLKSFGVDPTDPASVKAFLDWAKDASPDLYTMIVNQFEQIFGQNSPFDKGPTDATASSSPYQAYDLQTPQTPPTSGSFQMPQMPGLSSIGASPSMPPAL